MFTQSKYYFNRELSWLKFNQRVLQEALDRSNPLLERLRFIAIMSSNFDEFYMVRVAGLRHQEENGIIKYDPAHMDARAQLRAIDESAKRLMEQEYKYLHMVLTALEGEGLYFCSPNDLSDKQQAWLKTYFERTVYPVVTPLAVDSGHPFPFLANKTINTVVRLSRKQGGEQGHSIAILPIPSVLDRIIPLPVEKGDEKQFVLLEDVISYYAQAFFVGYEIDKLVTFRVTRDSDLSIDEEDTKDLLEEMEESLRRRRRGEAVRLEVSGNGDDSLISFVLSSLQLHRQDAFFVDGPLDLSMFFKFCDIQGYDRLRYKPFTPCHPREVQLADGESLFDQIRRGDIMVHHPFESFQIVQDFVAEAAVDPHVLAIKQTLYRVSGNSPIIASLIKAADLGKQVTVLMEVKARFDEENNILMARRLEKAGCHVIYGLKGLKTHSKITMVVRREEDKIRRYLHLATGNYNGKTACIYTDLGLFTCNDEFGDDASAFFNVISGYSDPPIWNKFAVAPLNLRDKVTACIDAEIRNVERGGKGHIIAKMNALLDANIIAKLYEASSKGVHIDLIVRGICTLRPGIPGVSENITVRSIIGRFLEHSRIFYFHNDGKERFFIGSADWMPRNLNDRVELMVPIEEERHKERVRAILELYLNDNQKAHVMRADGSYRKIVAKEHRIGAQEKLQHVAIRAQEKPTLSVIERMQPMTKEEVN